MSTGRNGSFVSWDVNSPSRASFKFPIKTETTPPPPQQYDLDLLWIFFIYSRERERELFGPKKRGPKPETFLLKVRKVLEASFSSFSCATLVNL